MHSSVFETQRFVGWAPPIARDHVSVDLNILQPERITEVTEEDKRRILAAAAQEMAILTYISPLCASIDRDLALARTSAQRSAIIEFWWKKFDIDPNDDVCGDSGFTTDIMLNTMRFLELLWAIMQLRRLDLH